MDSRHVKTINTDSRSKKRIRFASSKERSKKASADVYRSYKNRIGGGVTSAATRESFVHNPREQVRKKKRHKVSHAKSSTIGKSDDKTAFVRISKDSEKESSLDEKQSNLDLTKDEEEVKLEIATSFSSEVDVTLDRNASEIFSKFHRDIWILIRSLPEILHNLDKIIDILMSYMLSPKSMPESPTQLDRSPSKIDREEFVINHATTDILHLLSVLARDLRHEIHPYLHTKILPRILNDLLNPPPPPPESKKQPIPLDVTIVETAFRTLSYIFRYDSNLIVNDMESMRKYYGVTLGHRRELIRRLSAETFAPHVRKIKSQSARERHIRRVLRALASTTSQTKTKLLQRTQMDAVDGISNLLFQLVKGVPGKLHSQGGRSLKFILEYACRDNDSKKGNEMDTEEDLVYSVASGLLKKLFYHLNESGFDAVCVELFSLLSASIGKYMKALKDEKSDSSFHPIKASLKMIVQVATVREGKFLKARSDDDLKGLCDLISKLCSGAFLETLSQKQSCILFSSLCQIWVPLQTKTFIKINESVEMALGSQGADDKSVHSLSLIFANELLPLIEDTTTREAIMSQLIVSSAQVTKSNPVASLEIVFAVASAKRPLSEDADSSIEYGTSKSFELFDSVASGDLKISREDQNLLLDACLVELKDKKSKSSSAHLSFNLRCIPFLATLNGNVEVKTYKRIVEWFSGIFSKSSTSSANTTVVKGLAFEAFSSLTLKATELSNQASYAKKNIVQFKKFAGDLLKECGSSLWVVRGLASFIPILEKFSLGTIIDDTDEAFDLLMPNLRTANHFLRLHTLQLLASYPEKIFVVDHADLDLTDDLDEEQGYHPSNEDNKNGPVGPCDIIKVLLKLESSPISLNNERQINGFISKVEILARTRRLPVVYAEVAANHMIGIFNVKFAPIWRSAEKALLSLLVAHEETVWSSFETKLVSVMKGIGTTPPLSIESDGYNNIVSQEGHFEACLKWEKSGGRDVSLFEASLLLVDGEVPCYHITDAETVMESVWNVAEQGHRVVAKHSRGIVPLFLSFLHNQYFAFHSNDQGARELHLSEFVEKDSSETEKIQGYIMQKRLKCFLRTFSAIEGPKQLIKHQLLEKIFRSFLSHQDITIAGYSISCLMKFKFDYLTPYSKHLKEMMQKGKLRNSLLNLSEVIDEGKMNNKDRKMMLPILARILFGRVSARSGKSSNDSPAARRAAVLSFMSVICKEEEDFFPFLYLMTRSFIPQTEEMSLMESYESDDRSHILDTLMRTSSDDMALLPGPVIEGFLHLLQSVLSQFGHHVISWIPQLTAITVELCNFVKVGNETVVGNSLDAKTDGEEKKGSVDSIRRSSIRTLCFQRLCDIFSLFGSSIDFSPFAEKMWSAIQPSLTLLPEMVIRNDGCPAILTLLQTMSADANLIRMLYSHDDAVHAVVKCISVTSRISVIQVSLTFIENLLSVTDEDSELVGKELVCKFAPLLLEQFTMRLEGKEEVDTTVAVGKSKLSLKNSPTWRRELQILFRICGLFSFEEWETETEQVSFVETLCNLLIPFLEPNNGTLNDDKVNVVGILNEIVGKLQPEVALSVFWRLSSILAPHKSRVGIEMLPIRSSIAALIDKAAATSSDFKTVSAIVVKLSSVNKTRVDEIDFETVIPELLSLAKEEKSNGNWSSIYDSAGSNPNLLVPIINVCFHFLHNEDGVISRASFNALKALIIQASSHIHSANENAQTWIKMVESSMIPLSRSGLQSKDSKVRRYYILLIREFAREFSNIPSTNLCGDLSTLCDDENHDLDFFLGITHVQIHRRARAFQRLRKALSQIDSDESKSKISSQSLSSVLLPLALHPIYECKMRSEESFALDAIATLGAIARHLPWNKYNNILWLILNQFDRFPEQERYSVGALCAIIDGFNFELTKEIEADGGSSQMKTSVWTSLENRIIPKIEGLFSKETTDKNGDRGKTIRPAIILALVKLFQKFPEEFFDTKLPSILAVICDALRNKDSSARDVARNTLAKMVCSIDLKYLGDVIREVAITLNEGYKLHVRAATIHTILLQLLNIYEPSSVTNGEVSVPFDDCTAAIMDLLQDDLFGVANERRESQETAVRFVKEAGGNKSVHSIEMLCRMITFAPSKARSGNQSRSAVHCIISPLLERLRLPDIDAKMIRKVKEVLSRIAIGISNNKSLKGSELFPFVYATIHPFIGSAAISTIQQDDDEEDDGDGINIKISGGKKSQNSKNATPAKSAASVVAWRPSTLHSSDSRKSAVASKKNEIHALKKVQDGASAPKLTGSGRHSLLETFDIRTINEPATITAIVFGLNLMNASLKKIEIRDEKSLLMLDPFVPMLTACVCHCRDTEVALVALKCLLALLRSDLPSIPSCSKSIGSKTLTLLSSAGSSLSTNHDLTQACFKTLTHLIGTKVKPKASQMNVDEEHGIEGELPLTPEQMKVLISLIKASITDTEQHNPALNLIKVILMRRFLSPELYDLMESLMKLVVRSPKALLRQECAKLFVRYLLDYPMGEGRFEQHLKQIVANISYEYQEGRLSGMMLLTLVVEKLPQELLQANAQHIFLPLVLQLVNDDSKDCRAEVSKCLMLLLKRSSTELLQTFQDYCHRWSKQVGPLRLASLQVFGILIDSRADFIKSSSLDLPWIQHFEETLSDREELDWETTYFSILCVEKMLNNFKSALIQQSKLMTSMTECLTDPHPWVKMSSSRVMNNLLTSSSAITLLSENNGMLFQIVRNTLFQFNVSEDEHSQELADLGAKTLAFALPLMAKHPEFCYTEDSSEDEDSPTEKGRDPVFWLLRRLSQVAKTKGRKRRMTIFKCYAAFASNNFQIVAPHLELMLEGLHRSITEAKSEMESKELSQKRSYSSFKDETDVADTENSFAQEVLGLIEESCESSSDFLNAYAEVKRRAYQKKQKRKTEEKIEAAQNPQLAAERRMAKQERNKRRKKRRSEEMARERGRGEKRYRHR